MGPGTLSWAIFFACFYFGSTICDIDLKKYYAPIDTTVPAAQLKHDLHDLLKSHTVLTYSAVWDAFTAMELGKYGCNECCTTSVGDVYSPFCWTPVTEQCGHYSKEGDCYNREHSFPSSWFGSDKSSPAYTDLHHVFPSDGYVNSVRGNHVFGYVKDSTYTSGNNATLGTCAHDASLMCFELPDEMKGEFARAYFYFAIRYMDEFACCDGPGNSGASLKPWMEEVLREWHVIDPVDLDEIRRNDITYCDYQNNRNPFVDYPEWVDLIADF